MSPETHYLISSESVSEGHPDKICDQVSDAILDLYITNDPNARVAVECLVTTNKLIISGEIRSRVYIPFSDIENIARQCIREIGYEQLSFHWEKIDIEILLHDQSLDIASCVDETSSHPEGAGDQGMMFGYACDETDVLLPATLYYSHQILRNLSTMRKQMDIGILPDAKVQLTAKYIDNKPESLHAVVLSMQHKEFLSSGKIKDIAMEVLYKSLPSHWLTKDTKIYINPAGRFVIGGPDSDTGLTGRKIIVDTYGGFAPHGGGAFSGKDPTKVDRSGAYMARFLAKNLVAAKIAKKCTLQLAYIIGINKPISIFLDFHSTSCMSEELVIKYIQQNFDLTPKGIRNFLRLNAPIYRPTAAYGHFGRYYNDDGLFTWEDITFANKIKNQLNM